MKKIVLSTATMMLLAFNFNGCANSGLAVSNSGVMQTFKEGKVIKVQKVLVGKSNLAKLSISGAGAALGAGAGSLIGNTKGAVIGAGVGAIAGAVFTSFQEVEAFQTTIFDGKQEFITYLEIKLEKDQKIEFVSREDGLITNVSVL